MNALIFKPVVHGKATVTYVLSARGYVETLEQMFFRLFRCSYKIRFYMIYVINEEIIVKEYLLYFDTCHNGKKFLCPQMHSEKFKIIAIKVSVCVCIYSYIWGNFQ